MQNAPPNIINPTSPPMPRGPGRGNYLEDGFSLGRPRLNTEAEQGVTTPIMTPIMSGEAQSTPDMRPLKEARTERRESRKFHLPSYDKEDVLWHIGEFNQGGVYNYQGDANMNVNNIMNVNVNMNIMNGMNGMLSGYLPQQSPSEGVTPYPMYYCDQPPAPTYDNMYYVPTVYPGGYNPPKGTGSAYMGDDNNRENRDAEADGEGHRDGVKGKEYREYQGQGLDREGEGEDKLVLKFDMNKLYQSNQPPSKRKQKRATPEQTLPRFAVPVAYPPKVIKWEDEHSPMEATPPLDFVQFTQMNSTNSPFAPRVERMEKALGVNLQLMKQMTATLALSDPNAALTNSFGLNHPAHAVMIGNLTYAERKVKIEKYLEKRKKRIWSKKISYDCRKRVADNRLRIKGRFVTKEQAFAILGTTPQELLNNPQLKHILNSNNNCSIITSANNIKIRNIQTLLNTLKEECEGEGLKQLEEPSEEDLGLPDDIPLPFPPKNRGDYELKVEVVNQNQKDKVIEIKIENVLKVKESSLSTTHPLPEVPSDPHILVMPRITEDMFVLHTLPAEELEMTELHSRFHVAQE